MTYAQFFQPEFLPIVAHPATLVRTKTQAKSVSGVSANDVDRQALHGLVVQKLAAVGLAKLPSGKFDHSKLNRANQTPPVDMHAAYSIRAGNI